MVQKDNLPDNGNEKLLATIPKDQLRSLFYLFAGKPDSRIKVFNSAVHLDRNDFIELNQLVVRKLETHNVDATITSVKVGYIGTSMHEFGTWAEFESHHWQEPERIEEIVIKWDILVTIERYASPQRHTLMFRVSDELKPGKLLQMVTSGNSDEFDQLDVMSSPAFCRVDFINASLSRELVDLIQDWYKTRKSPVLIPQAYYWLKKRRHFVAEAFDHWTLFSWVLFLSSLFNWYTNRQLGGEIPNNLIVLMIFIGIYTLRPVSRVAHILAQRIYTSLSNLEGSKVLFEFTSGDKKHISELQNENKAHGKKFIFKSIWNIAINLISTALAIYLFGKS